jgi:flagellar biosynthesis/type III secretory pathway protein FliH
MIVEKTPRMIFERNVAMVISATTHTSINISEKEETVDMCKAIEEMLADAKAEGENLGLTQGFSQGRLEGKFESLAELVKDGILDISEAAKRVDMSVEEFERKIHQISRDRFKFCVNVKN